MRRSNRMKQKRDTSAATSDTASTVTIDLSETRYGYSYSEASKHRSCWVHILARKMAKGNNWRFEDDLDIKFWKRLSKCFLKDWTRRGLRSKRIWRREYAAPQPMGKLDSTSFDTNFRNIWDKFPEDKKALFAYVDCLWFTIYNKPTSRQTVLSWIKKPTIFSKKYVIVPIVLWDHWNLLILCNFDESLGSDTRKPCMLLLDSLENAGPTRYQPLIRKFVVDVFQTLGRPETKKNISKIPFILPKVPQQTNEVECGKFVLYFIQLFVNAAPTYFDISNGHHDFMNENWFDRESFENFCNQLT